MISNTAISKASDMIDSITDCKLDISLVIWRNAGKENTAQVLLGDWQCDAFKNDKEFLDLITCLVTTSKHNWA